MPTLIYCTQSQILGRTRSVAVMQKFSQICDETSKKSVDHSDPRKSILCLQSQAEGKPCSTRSRTEWLTSCTQKSLKMLYMDNFTIIPMKWRHYVSMFYIIFLMFVFCLFFLIKLTAHKKTDKPEKNNALLHNTF